MELIDTDVVAAGYVDKSANIEMDKLFVAPYGFEKSTWDPSTDYFPPENFNAENMNGKAVCKVALLQRLGLSEHSSTILVGCNFSEGADIDEKKMKDNILNAKKHDVQFIFMETSERPNLNQAPESLHMEFKDENNIKFVSSYDEALSHLLFVGSDITLCQSFHDPTDETPLKALRYGAVPIAVGSDSHTNSFSCLSKTYGSVNENKLLSYDVLLPPTVQIPSICQHNLVVKVAQPPPPPKPPDLCCRRAAAIRFYSSSLYHSFHIHGCVGIQEKFHAYDQQNRVFQLNSIFKTLTLKQYDHYCFENHKPKYVFIVIGIDHRHMTLHAFGRQRIIVVTSENVIGNASSMTPSILVFMACYEVFGDLFVKGNYCPIVGKVCWNLDHKLIVYCEICQSSNVTTPYILVSHTVFNSRIMVHDGSITCCDFKKYVRRVPCHDFSSMFDMCEIGPWGLIDPTSILCKALDDEVIIYIPFYSVTDKIIPPTFDSWPNIEIKNYIGTWSADSEYNDYHAVDWHIALGFQNC